MEVNDRINQLWNLPETLWQAFSRPGNLSSETRQNLAIGALAIGCMVLLHNQYKKMLHEHSNKRPLSPSHQRKTYLPADPIGYKAEIEPDSPKAQSKQGSEEKLSEAALETMGVGSSETKEGSIVARRQALPEHREAFQKRAFQIRIKAYNRRKFSQKEVERRLPRSFLQAQKNNDKPNIDPSKQKAISWKEFPTRVDNVVAGFGEFEDIPASALDVQRFKTQDKNAPALGGACMQGLRDTMEDCFAADSLSFPLENEKTLSIPFVSLFDGHGGSECATFFAKNIKWGAETALKQVPFNENRDDKTDIVNALTLLYIPMTEAYLKEKEHRAKSVAIAAFQIKNSIYVTNAGDSRAILVKGGHTFALSRDHRPRDHKKAIKKRGGWVRYFKNGLALIYGPWWRKKLPDCAGGAMARGVGYPEVGTGMNPRGEVIEFEITDTKEPREYKPGDSKEPQFLVMCCDGVWDVLSTNQVGQIVRDHSDKTPAQIAAIIIKQAYCNGSWDNLTALVVPVPLKPAKRAPNHVRKSPGANTALVPVKQTNQ